MDAVTHLRILAHLLWVAWAVTVFFLAYASRGKKIRITWVAVAMLALVALAAWFGVLLFTVRGVELLPRSATIPTLAGLELGSVLLAWLWVILCGSENYNIEFRRNDKTPILLVAWLSVLFLA